MKVVAGYAAIGLLIALVLAFTLRALHALHGAAEAITQDSAQDVLETARLQDASERTSSSARGFLMTRAATHLLDLEDARAEFHISLGRLFTMLESAESRRLLEAIHKQEAEYRGAVEPLLELRRASEDVARIGSLYEDRVTPKRNALDASIDDLMARQHQKFIRAADDLTRVGQRTIPTVGGLAAVCLFAILIVAIVFTRMLNRQYQIERVARQAREEVLALVSHDLKNPLNAILMSAVLVERGAPSGDPGAAPRKHAATIQRSARRMSALLGDLLDVASIESGRFQIEAKPCAAGPLIAEALDAIGPLATEKSLRLDKDIAEPDTLIHADRERLLQVLGNLLGNAVKFTPEDGRVVVKARKDRRRMHFSVSDTGPGIPREQRVKVFERFIRGARSGGGGTGLGLYIVQGIVTAHGGEVWIEGGEDRGATVCFTIPLAED